MLNFELYNPTRLIFGKGEIARLPEFTPKTKILLVYGGGSIFKNGIYDQVKHALGGYDITEFGGIEANPRFETAMKAVETIRQKGIEFILAVGGGSVIDAVKFMSAAVHFDGDPIEILRKRMMIKENAMPFGTVLTIPATGSEMNSGAVISIEATHEKLSFGGQALFPKFSICDPTVISSLPKRQIQNGVVDAYTHVLEQYLTYKHDAFLQDRIGEAILTTLIEIGPGIVENPDDYTLQSNLMWCCTMALNGLLNKGVPTDWATHSIGHELTALYGIDHARTLAIIGPNLYRAMFESKMEKLAQYGRRIFNLQGTDEEVAKAAIDRTSAFFESMGMELRISQFSKDTNAPEIIEKRFTERGWRTMGEKQLVTPEKVRQIVEASL